MVEHPTLLWMSSSLVEGLGPVLAGERCVDLAGDVAFEAADDFLLGLAFFGAPFDVVLRSGVLAHADEDNAVEGGVGLAVAGSVEAVPVRCLAGGGW
jgi:hypothetical protein